MIDRKIMKVFLSGDTLRTIRHPNARGTTIRGVLGQVYGTRDWPAAGVYESTYYHIYGLTPLMDDILDPIIIGIPQSEPADSDVQRIVEALNRMVSRRDRKD